VPIHVGRSEDDVGHVERNELKRRMKYCTNQCNKDTSVCFIIGKKETRNLSRTNEKNLESSMGYWQKGRACGRT
jgi:hypothetical protein